MLKLKSPFCSWRCSLSGQATGALPSPGVDACAGKPFHLQKTAFLYSNLSNLGLNRVRLADLDVCQNFQLNFFFFNSTSHLKEIHFHHRRNLKLNAASETETRLK